MTVSSAKNVIRRGGKGAHPLRSVSPAPDTPPLPQSGVFPLSARQDEEDPDSDLHAVMEEFLEAGEHDRETLKEVRARILERLEIIAYHRDPKREGRLRGYLPRLDFLLSQAKKESLFTHHFYMASRQILSREQLKRLEDRAHELIRAMKESQ